MQPYNEFRYYFPPRPEVKSPTSGLATYERMGFIGQPKLNGSMAELYTSSALHTDSSHMRLMGRHQDSFARELIPRSDLAALHKGSGWQCICAEYMNKSKKDGNNKTFNGCLVIFDILVHKGQYLTGTSFAERQEILDSLYSSSPYDKWIDQIDTNVFRVKNFTSNFVALYNEIIEIDMYEGWVLKRPNGILETGLRPGNNTGWQLKVRKPTKNYTY